LIACGFIFSNAPNSFPRRNAIWISLDGGSTWDGPLYVDAQTGDAGYGDILYSATLGKYVFISYQGETTDASLVQYNVGISGI
jgi:hypothetical protein